MIEITKTFIQITADDKALIKAIESGLPIVSRPYEEIAKQLHTTEENIISRLQQLVDKGAIKRYGIIVRHQELGYTANGMVVWNIPDNKIEEVGTFIGKFPCVTLSYRRPRRLPNWPYNLFTMVHGSSREEVKHKVKEIAEQSNLKNIEHTILFSTRRFKQRGASYSQNNTSTQSHKNTLLRIVK